MSDDTVRVVGEALLDLLPEVYGHRIGDDPAVLEGTALGRDAATLAGKLLAAGVIRP